MASTFEPTEDALDQYFQTYSSDEDAEGDSELEEVVQDSFSEFFCEEDAEVTFRSSDDTLFKIHAANLKVCTGGFAPPDGSTFDEVVHLSETSETLELLFTFIYPVEPPEDLDIEFIEFEVLEKLAEAAEKYEVFSAMNVCRFYMRKAVPEHAAPVFAYALKHDYSEIINEAAPHTLDLPLDEVIEMIPEHILPWVRYHDRWNQVVNYALSHRPVMTPTNNAADKMIDMVAAMVGSLSTLLTLDSSKQAGNPLNEWIDAVASEVAKIPEFCELILYKNESTLQDPTSQSTDTPGASEINIPQGSEASKVHSEHSTDETDMVFISSDDECFHVPMDYVDICSPRLADSTESDSEPIRLPITSVTLDLLLQFMHPARHPDISSVDFDTLMSVAFAAEEYEVYPAMIICRVYMKNTLPLHPDKILEYAALGDYEDILDLAAPLCITIPLEDIVDMIPENLFDPWTNYYQCWNRVAMDAICFYKDLEPKLNETRLGHHTRCGCLPDYEAMGIISKLAKGASALQDLDSTFHCSRTFCASCSASYLSWRASVETAIKTIPGFHTFFKL